MASAPIDFDYFLQRKYAQLQQGADATTSNAASTAISANANAVASNAAAGLDVARTAVLPAQVASETALQGAQAKLFGTQASVLPGTAASENALRAAQAGLTNSQAGTLNTVVNLGGNQTRLPTIGSVTGPAVVQGPTDALAIPTIGAGTTSSTAQQPGETHLAWVTRLRGMGYGR